MYILQGEKGETVISDRDLAVIKADVVDLKNQTTLVHGTVEI